MGRFIDMLIFVSCYAFCIPINYLVAVYEWLKKSSIYMFTVNTLHTETLGTKNKVVEFENGVDPD